MSLTGFAVEFATETIGRLGYSGLFVMMLLESTAAPIPSEAVMPFAGFLVVEGRFTVAGAMLASSLGSLAGSLLSYYLGATAGRAVILHWGRFVLLRPKHLADTESFFARHGGGAVFWGRFVPVVRHLISIPAGMARMPLAPFTAATVVGASAWNGFLLYVGMAFRERWEEAEAYLFYLDIAVVVGLLAAGVYVVFRLRRDASAT
ncbi:MAG: DedA family protein [Methanobacteriota archaeon]